MKTAPGTLRLATLFAVTLLAGGEVLADVPGLEGQSFDLTARATILTMPDGQNILAWGYGPTSGVMQYPGPTLIVRQGVRVQVTLRNALPESTSIVFPGQPNVTTSGGTAGLLTAEVPPGGAVTYAFTPSDPGTYVYHSGTRSDVQVEMGLVGALIVRPTGFDPAAPRAYNDPAAAYDREYLFLQSEMDPRIHDVVQAMGTAALADTDFLSDYRPQYWFLNGRVGPDTFMADGVPWMPHQPYGSMARLHPGERLLMRVVGGGRQSHPFHHHGNHAEVIAQNGRLSKTDRSAPRVNASYKVFTIQTEPGETVDAIWGWTGEKLGWDVYGHQPGDALQPGEYAPDHGKPLPIDQPELQSLAFGGFYSGSPYLGTLSALPPGEGGLNVNGGYHFMWHSHTERELVNYDIFPGGMMTMAIVEPPWAPIND